MRTKVRFDRFTNCLKTQIKPITLTHYSMHAFNYGDNMTKIKIVSQLPQATENCAPNFDANAHNVNSTKRVKKRIFWYYLSPEIILLRVARHGTMYVCDRFFCALLPPLTSNIYLKRC